MNESELIDIIVKCAEEVHRTLGGPGLLASLYEEALIIELNQHKLQIEKQLPVPVKYKGRVLGTPIYLNLRINKRVLLDIRSMLTLDPVFEAQMRTCLHLTGLKLGFVINFGERDIQDGIRRVTNNV